MKALVLEEYGKFVYEDVEKPVPGKGEVLIRVKACSVCGSDVHGMDGTTGRRQPPVIMGHEAAGVIEECGEGVTDYHPGDRVTFDSTIYCNECEACRSGNVNLCTTRQVIGVSCDDYRRNGAFAEYITVPSYVLYPLPDNVSFVAASLVEPMSVAYHAIVQAPLPQKGAALVMGCGTIGVLAVLILKGLGVENIIAVDIEPRRLALAKESGATLVINSRTEPLAEIVKEATGGKGVEVAYDMTGIELTVNQCVELAQDNGYIVLVGNLNPTISFPMVKTILKQLKVHGSCASAGEYTQCLEMIASGKVDTEKIVSKCVPLAEGNEWIHKVYNREDQLDKIVLIP